MIESHSHSRVCFMAIPVFLVLVMLLLTACVGAPNAASSEYLRTLGGGFQHDRKDVSQGWSRQNLSESSRYWISLGIVKPINEKVRLVVQYENPSNPGTPVTQNTSIGPAQKELMIKSPPISGFKEGSTYKITINGYQAGSSQSLFTHVQNLKFEIPQF